MAETTREVTYKCDTAEDYTALLAYLGAHTPAGYTRSDDAVNRCVVFEATSADTIPA